jgi:hypothetical protein
MNTIWQQDYNYTYIRIQYTKLALMREGGNPENLLYLRQSFDTKPKEDTKKPSCLTLKKLDSRLHGNDGY